MIAHMTQISTEQEISQMFNEISHAYDKNNHILSLGLDRRWRKKLALHLPEGENLSLLDLATGTCDQLLPLMATGKFESALGIDLAEGMLEFGKQKISSTPYKDQISLKVASALEIPTEPESFDCVTISFGIRNVGSLPECLKEIHRVLAPGGRALILEFSLPKNRLIRPFHLLYLRHILPFVGGLVSGKMGAYRYLNKTIESFPYGEAFLGKMQEAGFSKVQALPLTLGVATLYIGDKG